MNKEIQDLGLKIYLHYEDVRYPTLVIQSKDFGSVGYSLDLSSGQLERVCLCNARSDTECVCGAWDSYTDSAVP